MTVDDVHRKYLVRQREHTRGALSNSIHQAFELEAFGLGSDRVVMVDRCLRLMVRSEGERSRWSAAVSALVAKAATRGPR